MDEERILRRAALAWSDGLRSEALRILKDGVRLDPSPGAVRRTLAERYREMGHPDQAGRWGIVIDGWTTDLERDRLARLLAASGIDEPDAARFLALPDGHVPESVMELLRGPTPVYSDRFRARLEEVYVEPENSPFFVLTVILWVLAGIISLGGAYTIFGFVVFGSATSFLARTILLIVNATMALALAASAAQAATMKAKGWAIGWGLGSLVVGALTVWVSRSGWTLT